MFRTPKYVALNRRPAGVQTNLMKSWHFLQVSFAFTVALAVPHHLHTQQANDLWQVYQTSLSKAKYVGLTHTITPTIPVWKGFGPSKSAPTVNPENGRPYTYDKDGFEATAYQLSTDQLGTQLDPPAHWNPAFSAIDETSSDVLRSTTSRHLDRRSGRERSQIRLTDAGHSRLRNETRKNSRRKCIFVRCDWSRSLTRDRAQLSGCFACRAQVPSA